MISTAKFDSIFPVKPIQAWTDPEGSRRLRLPGILDNRHMKVANIIKLNH
jgi:hypothetical protein